MLLPTKLYMPPPRPGWVERPRLLQKLTVPRPVRLVLVSAPAGYGKTTLVTSWLQRVQAAGETAVCWLALDEDDSDPLQFMRYLAAAVRPLPSIPSHLPALLQSSQPVPAKALMTAFVRDVTAVDGPFYLVLDDYHALDSADIDAALAVLLDHMPAQMTLVLTSRADPGFSIARLRARGQLIELRAEDLRFTPQETAVFMQQSMHITLMPDQIAALENRTEGWAAGLQMAALSLQARAEGARAEFVQSFTGSHRFVLDFLVDEVLGTQPQSVSEFLLATSILDRLSGPLCDAVRFDTAVVPDTQLNSQTILETLEHDNLFVIPLDDERSWYRYHHLFADVLRSHALTSQARQLPLLHRRAAEWFAANGFPSDAVRHALAANAFAYAAELIEQARPLMEAGNQSAAWLDWVQALPDELVRTRPVLSAGYAWALLDVGELAACEERLQDAERWLAATPEAQAADMIVADHEQFEALPASIAAARAYRSLALGDVDSTVTHARQVLALLPEGNHQWRRAALALLGVASWTSGDLAAAGDSFAAFYQSQLDAGVVQDALSIAYVLADTKLAQGRLREAEQGYVGALNVARAHGDPPGTSDLYRGLAEIAREQGKLDTAEQLLTTAAELGEQASLTDWPRRLNVARALLAQSEGDMTRALDLLDEANRLRVQNPLPDVRPVPAMKARVLIRAERLDAAQAWARLQELTPDDDLSYLHEYEHVTLARLLLARFRRGQDDVDWHTAVSLLRRLLAAAEAGGRMGSALEMLVLLALAHDARGDIDAALVPLGRALAFAAREGYVRLFVEEGTPMLALLRAAASRGADMSAIEPLLAGFGEIGGGTAVAQPLIDPLSGRELEILALIAAGLKNQEIADQLVISLNTVLYHNKNIYGKLGVNKRALAIARARELRLIE